MKFITRFKRAWKAETPKVWRAVRNLTATVSVAAPSAWVITSQLPSVSLPEWFGKNVAYITFASLIVTGIAGTRKKKAKKAKTDKLTWNE